MDNKILLGLSLMATMSLSSCQNDEVGNNVSNARLQVEASVSNVFARTTSSLEQGHTSFVDGDAIGLFLPESDEATKWSYKGGTWSSDPHDWPSQSTAYEFCAYYPYAKAATYKNIPMPDLTKQSGELENIGAVDFLVAKRTVSYKDDNGKVAFTGEYAFKHQYSLLVITLVKETNDSETTINSASISGKGIFSKHTYSFESPAGMKSDADATTADKLDMTIGKTVGNDGCQIALVLNPNSESTALNFSIAYTRDGVNYKASTEGINRAFESGTCYKYKICIKKQGLVISGSDITDWTIEEIEKDIIVNDIPQTESE